MNGRYGMRSGARATFSGTIPGMRRNSPPMGGWWEDLTGSVSSFFDVSKINWNPTDSPYWQSTVSPALDVVGTVAGVYYTGVPIPAGSIATKALGGGPAPAQTPQKPYTPATFNGAPSVPASAAAAPDTTTSAMTWLIGGTLLAGGAYLYHKSPPARAARS